jgi:hypothetical protein
MYFQRNKKMKTSPKPISSTDNENVRLNITWIVRTPVKMLFKSHGGDKV